MASGSARLINLSDLPVPVANPDPNSSLPGFEFPLGLPALNAAAINTQAAQLPGRIKSFALLVTTQLAWVTGGQPTVIPYHSRSPQAASTGALPANGNDSDAVTVGSAANLGPSAATTLAVGLYWFSPVQLPDLQWWAPYVGMRVVFPSALTGGAATAFFEMGGI